MHITCSGNGPLHSSEGYTEMILYMLHKGIISLQYPSSPVLYIKLYVTLSISLYLSISHTHTHTHTDIFGRAQRKHGNLRLVGLGVRHKCGGLSVWNPGFVFQMLGWRLL